MSYHISYWLKGERVQNFGDYLTDFFMDRLFYDVGPRSADVRIIGSCIDDGLLGHNADGSPRRTIFWGCGLRHETSLSERAREHAEILAVRGPLSRSALRLGAAFPIGDPGLLLPALHSPRRIKALAARKILVPHFLDLRSDDELMELSHCDLVVRPNIDATPEAVTGFIDTITSADFVLCGALHAGITMAAYGGRFAFWESGSVDIPFKWRDFAASVQVPCLFAETMEEAEAIHERDLAPNLRIPPLTPLVAVAPFPVRAAAMAAIVEGDLARHGDTVLEWKELVSGSRRLATHIASFKADQAAVLQRNTEAEAAAEALAGERDQALERMHVLEAERNVSGEQRDQAVERVRVLETELGASAEQRDQAVERVRVLEVELGASAEQRDQAVERARVLEREISASGDRRAAELRRLTAAERLAVESNRERELLRAQLESASALAAASASERDQVQQAMAEARQAADADATTLRYERDQAQREASDAMVRLHSVEGTLDAVWSSTSWRALEPFRRIGRRSPSGARLVRRSLKLAWWTLTLQLHRRFAAWRLHDAMIRAQEAQPDRTVLLVEARPASHDHSADPPLDNETRVDTVVEAAPDTLPISHDGSVDLPLDNESKVDTAAEAVPDTLPQDAELPPEQAVVVETTAGPSKPPKDLKAAFETLYGTEAIYFPPVENPEVSIIIPVYRGFDDLITCLRSLSVHRETEPSFEVILVDDSPDAPVLWALPRSGGLTGIQNEENLGFLLSCNLGATKARGRVLCFLNSDTIVSRGWLGSLVQALDETPRAALSGSMLLNRDGTIQDAGWRILGNGWGHPLGRGADARDGAYTHRRLVDCVTGACFCIARETWDGLGGFDIAYAPAFYEEFDLAFRARQKGLAIVYEPRSRVVHLGSSSYGAERRDQLSRINHATFSDRFAEALRKQPYDVSDEFPLRHAGPQRPTILVVDYNVPVPEQHAGDVTMASYLRLLVEAGWRVVFGPHNGQASGPSCERLESWGVEMIRPPQTIAGWLSAHGEHVRQVWIGRPELAGEYLPTIREVTDAPVAYYTHDLHHLRMAREAALREDESLFEAAQAMQTLEVGVLNAVDHVMTPSAEEGQIIGELAPEAKVSKLAPYFYGPSDFRARNASHFKGLTDVLFVGGFPHTPNVDAALYLVNEVMPLVWQRRPEARLLLVGYAPPPEVRALASESVIVTGQVPDLAPWFDRARLMLAPLRYGAGVKGKVVEALRDGIPVVTTPIGAEGIGLTHGRDVIIAEDSIGLAKAVLSLLDDAKLCARMSSAGAATAAREFSVVAARARIEAIFGLPRCAACGSTKLQRASDRSNIRESFVCGDCYALARCDALAQVILKRFARKGETSLPELLKALPSLRIHELGFVGGIADSLRGFPNYSVSEYFPGVPLGEAGPGGVRCEDVTALTYSDASFDVVLSQDVMEHVPDPVRGFGETARVLRPGGAHFFTIPQNRNLEHSVTRAALGPNGVEYILPAEYHGDPVRSEGALVFTDYGRDLPELVAQAGLKLVEHEVSVLGGDPGEVLRVFEAVKPSA